MSSTEIYKPVFHRVCMYVMLIVTEGLTTYICHVVMLNDNFLVYLKVVAQCG